LRFQPVVDVLAHHVFCQAITLLELAFELVALAVDGGQIVVGELTPLFLDLAFGLLPVSSMRFQSIVISTLYWCRVDNVGRAGGFRRR